MALLADYCTSAELKAYLRITGAEDDAQVALAITSASRVIDQAAGRAFGIDDTPVARVFTPGSAVDAIDLPDIASLTGLVIKTDTAGDYSYSTTLDAADYRLEPLNALVDGRPWDRISWTTGITIPTSAAGLQVTAKWGWPAVPTAIKNACLIQAGTILKGGRDSPLGIAGSPEFGNEMRLSTRLHPIAAELVRPYENVWAVA